MFIKIFLAGRTPLGNQPAQGRHFFCPCSGATRRPGKPRSCPETTSGRNRVFDQNQMDAVLFQIGRRVVTELNKITGSPGCINAGMDRYKPYLYWENPSYCQGGTPLIR
jgi:hypothetical protein